MPWGIEQSTVGRTTNCGGMYYLPPILLVRVRVPRLVDVDENTAHTCPTSAGFLELKLPHNVRAVLQFRLIMLVYVATP